MTDQTNPSNNGEPGADDVSKARPAPEYGWYAPGFDPNARKEAAQATQPTQQPQYQTPQYGQSQAQNSPYGPPVPAPQFGAQGSMLPQAPAKTNTLATVSLVAGIVGLVGFAWFYGLVSVVAVITGHMALYRIKRSRENGRGMAIAGLVLGYIGIAIILLIVAAVVYVMANPDILREMLNDPTITSQLTPEQLDQLRDFIGESGSATGNSFGTNGGQNV